MAEGGEAGRADRRGFGGLAEERPGAPPSATRGAAETPGEAHRGGHRPAGDGAVAGQVRAGADDEDADGPVQARELPQARGGRDAVPAGRSGRDLLRRAVGERGRAHPRPGRERTPGGDAVQR